MSDSFLESSDLGHSSPVIPLLNSTTPTERIPNGAVTNLVARVHADLIIEEILQRTYNTIAAQRLGPPPLKRGLVSRMDR